MLWASARTIHDVKYDEAHLKVCSHILVVAQRDVPRSAAQARGNFGPIEPRQTPPHVRWLQSGDLSELVS